MTTENQPARMGDAELLQRSFDHLHGARPEGWTSEQEQEQWLTLLDDLRNHLDRARELSAHGGDGGGEFGPIGDAELDAARELNPIATQQPASGEDDEVEWEGGAVDWIDMVTGRQPYTTTPAIAAHGGSGEGIEDLCQRLAEHGAKSGRRAATKQYSDGVPTHTEMLMGQAIDAIRRLSAPAYAKVISSQDGLLGRSSTSPIRTRGPGDTGQSGTLESLAAQLVSEFPMVAIVRAFNNAAPGFGAALTPPTSASDAEVEAACKVEPNTCQCHPETCCCPDYKLIVNGNEMMKGSWVTCDRMLLLIRSQVTRSPARVGGDARDAIAERLYQAAWMAEGFVEHAAKTAAQPRLAQECLDMLGSAITDYRIAKTTAITQQANR